MYPSIAIRVALAGAMLAGAARYAAAQPSATAAAEPSTPLVTDIELHPFLVLVGGFHFDHIVNRSSSDSMVADERQSRLTTLSMTRFGFETSVHPRVSARSEIELSAGPHGTSVWEGQAALTVRDQYVRLDYDRVRVDVGRISDPASIDYYSTNVANLLLSDFQLRLPFLASGANRGNGVLAHVELGGGLTGGLTVNAGNPVSNTGTAMLGGTYPPFSRFYFNIIATVRESATRFPSDLFYAVLASPSLMYDRGPLRAQLQYQYVYVDVTTSDRDNPALEAHNVRGGIQARLLDGRLRPFVNASLTRNDVIASQGSLPDISMLNDDQFRGRTIGVGVDFDVTNTVGVGGQYNRVTEQQGDGAVFDSHFANVGASWWFERNLALQARYSAYLRCKDPGDGCELLENQHNYFITLLGRFGGAPADAAASF